MDQSPAPRATIPSKDEVSSPLPPTSPSAVPVPSVPMEKDSPHAQPMTSPATTTPPMPPPSSEGSKPSAPDTPLYKVRGKGETLREIARRTLGSGDRWRQIYRLNPDLQPELIVPSGKYVLLPADAKVDAAKCDGPMEGGQAESEHTGPSKPDVTAVRPLPVVRPHRPQMSEKSLAPLTGTYSCQLDTRSLVLPKEVAEQLGKVETMLLTPGPDRCLWLGTQASVARVLDRVEKSGATDHEVQAFRRLYFAQTEKASVNDSGKMMIPEKLAEYAGLGKEMVLVGIDDHFELWDAARWQHYSQAKESSLKP
jgi:MraZ protein